jgi:hypothetical protein
MELCGRQVDRGIDAAGLEHRIEIQVGLCAR